MKPHDISIFDHGAEKGRAFHLWERPDVPESVGPAYLGSLLRNYRTFVRGRRAETGNRVDTLGAISDDNLERLVLLAYRASFLTDEGRPIRACVVVRREPPMPAGRPLSDTPVDRLGSVIGPVFEQLCNAVEDYKLHDARFEDRIRLDRPEVLGRLSPVLLRPEGGITVVEDEGELFVSGLAALDREDTDWDLFDLPRNGRPSAGLVIELLGPGRLRVREGNAEFTLHADRLVYHQGVLGLHVVHDWLHGISRRLVATLRAGPDPPDTSHLLFEQEHLAHWCWPSADLVIMFSRLLRSALDLGHGGCYVFVPNIGQAPVDIKYRLQPIDLGAELIEVWRADCAVRGTGRNSDELLKAAGNKQSAVRRWLRRLRSIGQLTAADGCVVFDRDFVLHGYGGIIDTGGVSAGSERCVNLTGSGEVETTAGEVLRLHGTRHKWAYALCRSVPGTIAIVISQDGDLRLFASDGPTVYYATNLHP